MTKILTENTLDIYGNETEDSDMYDTEDFEVPKPTALEINTSTKGLVTTMNIKGNTTNYINISN
jgi:hypothetical protein